jgi:hypothetical protein
MSQLRTRARTILSSRSGYLALSFSTASWLLLAYAAWHVVEGYSVGFRLPLIDNHPHRQTQTALSAYYLAQGGPLFAYETPLFGAPYSMPFEFPLFQWLAALVHRCGMPLDPAGRAVNIGFFVLTLIPFARIIRHFGGSPSATRLTLAVLLCAPLYRYYTRTFLIESTALFFAVWALSLGLEILEERTSGRRMLWLAAVAAVAMLVKATTGYVYLSILGLLLAGSFISDRQRRSHLRFFGTYAAAAFVLPLIPTLAWTWFAEQLKADNTLTDNYLTAAALKEWNYGTWEQKTALASWGVLWDRTMYGAFGSALSFAAGGALALFAAKRVGTVVCFGFAVLLGYATFTNLHLHHDYYQYSTVALPVAMVGAGISAVEGSARGKLLVMLLASAMVVHSLATYETGYGPAQTRVDLNVVAMAEFVKERTSDSALIVVHGDDWTPVLPYYMRRRSIMNRTNLAADQPAMKATLERSRKLGNRVEAVLFCYGDRLNSDARAEPFLAHAPQCMPVFHCNVCL